MSSCDAARSGHSWCMLTSEVAPMKLPKHEVRKIVMEMPDEIDVGELMYRLYELELRVASTADVLAEYGASNENEGAAVAKPTSA